MAVTHQHTKVSVIKAQLAYAGSLLALETGKYIIATKIKNSRALLARYARARRRAGSDDEADAIKLVQNRLSNLAPAGAPISSRQQLFLIEARAAKLYWPLIGRLCRQSNTWRRFYPHATDPLNVLLNSGYTFLARQCLQSLVAAGLLPEIGLLHGQTSREGLVYDVMECFRHIAVDAVVLPFFSRRHLADTRQPIFAQAQGRLAYRYQNQFLYRGRYEKLERVISFECLSLRQSILKSKAWKISFYPWVHRRRSR